MIILTVTSNALRRCHASERDRRGIPRQTTQIDQGPS